MAAKVTVTLDRSRVKTRIKAGIDKMIPAVAEQALADCNEYCRVDQGQLRQSSQTASDLKKGELVWNTPYAKKVYYTGEPSLYPNENASLKWCEKAHDIHGADWNKDAQKSFTEGMGT